MAKKSKVRRTKIDKYSAKASATRGERDRLIANLPSSQGLPAADRPSKTTQKKTPAG